MTDGDRVPAFVEQLVRTVAGGSGADSDERASTFARGLALGALVGAAIAGSTIWQRRHARVAASEAPSEVGDRGRATKEVVVGD